MKNADMPAMPIVCDGFGQFEPGVQVGLTKRETMAMHIASGFASSGEFRACDIAQISVDVADALLAALEKTK